MKPISELKLILSQQLTWHKSRIELFSMALLSLFICKDINLYKVAVTMPSKANIDSRYKRLKRFFAGFAINYDEIAKWVFSLFFTSDAKVYSVPSAKKFK